MTLPRRRLRLFGHGEEILARDLPDELRVVPIHVLLGVCQQLLVGLAADDAPALAVDQLRHCTLLSELSVAEHAIALERVLQLDDCPIVRSRACRYLEGSLVKTRIQVCGRLVAEVAGTRIEKALPGRQGRLLFTFLVVNRLRATSRDELVEALWPDGRDSGLSPLLSKLRHLVELEGRHNVRLVLPTDAWVDLEAATEGLHRAEAAVARGDWAAAWGPARVAQHIAQRGLLPSEEASWVEELRGRIEEIHTRSRELVAEACVNIGGGELDTAERAARALVQEQPFRESGWRLLMRVLAARGNRAEALRAYEELRSLLREELGTGPSPATQALHGRLLS